MAHLPSFPAGAPTTAFLNISTISVLQASGGMIAGISVITAGAAGGIFDAAATGTGTSGRQVWVIPATAGFYTINWPCASGIVVVPGSGQVLAVTLA